MATGVYGATGIEYRNDVVAKTYRGYFGRMGAGDHLHHTKECDANDGYCIFFTAHNGTY